MQRLFIETEGFRKRIDGFGGESLLKSIQSNILIDPEVGDIVVGLGGVRKMRMADPHRGKGKRGGFRVIYLDLSNRSRTYLLWIYGKNEAADISSQEKKTIRNLVAYLKQEN